MSDLDLSCFTGGKRYRMAISKEDCQSMPCWSPAAAELPPCSPQTALSLAGEFLRARLPENPFADWKLERFELRPIYGHFQDASPGYWFWVVIYKLCRKGPSSGLWPYFRVLVGMDGKIIQPIVTEEDPRWDAPERKWDTYILYS